MNIAPNAGHRYLYGTNCLNGPPQGGYGVGANGVNQGLGVNHMGGVQGVAGVNGQVSCVEMCH